MALRWTAFFCVLIHIYAVNGPTATPRLNMGLWRIHFWLNPSKNIFCLLWTAPTNIVDPTWRSYLTSHPVTLNRQTVGGGVTGH